MAKKPWGISGAFIFWMIKGFRGKFEDELDEKYLQRNMTVIIIVVVIILIFNLK